MKEFWDTLFGPHADSHTITALQMTVRAVLVFFAALALLRVSGKRTFGTNAAFDMVVKIMLGAVMSRAVVAASPFWGTLLAGFVLVGLHRLLDSRCGTSGHRRRVHQASRGRRPSSPSPCTGTRTGSPAHPGRHLSRVIQTLRLCAVMA